jgi:hypothetical protein
MHITPDDIKAIAQVLNTEQVKSLTVPVTKEVGKFLGELGDMVRVNGTDNMRRVIGRWMGYRDNRHLTDAEVKRVMPLLPIVSMQTDEKFTDKWAALLESAADGSNPYAASHANTLSQLSSEEARVLDTLYKGIAPIEAPASPDNRLLRFIASSKNIPIFLFAFGSLSEEDESHIYFDFRSSDDNVMRSNLFRLGLIEDFSPVAMKNSEPSATLRWMDDEGNVNTKQKPQVGEPPLLYRLSPFGNSFMKVVT